MEIRIDGYIGQESGIASLFGDGSSFSLRSLETILDGFSDDVIKVKINSGGGSVNEGFAIHDRLATSGAKIETEVLGLCGSIATIIALAAPKGSRKGHANSEYFIHNPYWQPVAPDPMEASDLTRLADELKDAEEKILDFYVEKTGAKRSELKKLMQEKTSLSMKEAKRLGFIDEIIEATVAEKKYAVLAYVDKKNDMNKFSDDQKSWLEKQFTAIETKIQNFLSPEVKEEKKEEVKEHSEIDALKAQIAELTAKLAEATSKIEAYEKEKQSIEAAKTELKTELDTIKNMVLAHAPEVKGNEFSQKGTGEVKKSWAEQVKELKDKQNKK